MSVSESSPPAATESAPTTESVAPSPSASGPSDGAYAIVETSGRQIWFQPDRYVDLDRLDAEVDTTVTLGNVLLVKDSSGTTLGRPYVEGASVEVVVMEHRRGSKITVYKMRPKKKTRRKSGHRQELTRVMVRSISVGAAPLG